MKTGPEGHVSSLKFSKHFNFIIIRPARSRWRCFVDFGFSLWCNQCCHSLREVIGVQCLDFIKNWHVVRKLSTFFEIKKIITADYRKANDS